MCGAKTYYAYLGAVEYRRALRLQERLRELVQAGECCDSLVLLEHPAVITLGRSSKRENILASQEQLRQMRIGVERVGRGGEVTYHGPGQLVGYGIRRVGRAVRAHVEGMASGLASYLEGYGIEARWDAQTPGLWVHGAKIAAVGVEIRRGVSMHGFALNLAPMLEHFGLIVPCGITRPVTSVAALGKPAPTPEVAAANVASAVLGAWGVRGEAVDAEKLWRYLEAAR